METEDPMVEEHLEPEALEEKIRRAPKGHMVRRLVFIKLLYNGASVEDAADSVGSSIETGEFWLTQWNDGGLDELVPDFRKRGWGTSSRPYSARYFTPTDRLPAEDYPAYVTD